MTGVDLHTMLEPIPSAGWSPGTAEDRVEHRSGSRRPASRSEGRSGPGPRSEGRARRAQPSARAVEVMLALSGRMDVEEPAAEVSEGDRFDASRERLAMLGMPFSL